MISGNAARLKAAQALLLRFIEIGRAKDIRRHATYNAVLPAGRLPAMILPIRLKRGLMASCPINSKHPIVGLPPFYTA